MSRRFGGDGVSSGAGVVNSWRCGWLLLVGVWVVEADCDWLGVLAVGLAPGVTVGVTLASLLSFPADAAPRVPPVDVAVGAMLGVVVVTEGLPMLLLVVVLCVDMMMRLLL